MSPEAGQLKRWREDPVTFVTECLRVVPDEWQVDMLRAFPRSKRLAGVACKGPGKTAAMAWLGWNFLLTRPHCKVPCTSITGPNLKDGLWAEFKKWQKRSPILSSQFEWTQTRIVQRQHPETWFASARTWAQDSSPEQQANTLAGLHEDYLFWLIDEAGDMPEGVVSAAEAALTGGIETKMALMGNCTRTEGPIWNAVGKYRHLYHVTRITGDPDDPKRSPRIDIEEARRQIAEHGRDSYIVKVNILAEFPDRQPDKLLDIRDCEAAMDRDLTRSVWENEAKVLGVDPARFGDDAATLSPRQGRMAFNLKEFRQLDTVELADQVVRFAESPKWKPDAVFIDEGGLGAGVVDQCRARGYSRLVRAVNFGHKAADQRRFVNKRTEMYFLAAEWVKAGGCLPNDPLLAGELSSHRYWFEKNRICLESKDDVKARLGRSPDRADGFVLTFASPVVAQRTREMADAQHRRTQRRAGRSPNDYDPLNRER